MGRHEILVGDWEAFETWIAATESLSSDLTLQRSVEVEAERLMRIERRLSWRIRHLEAYLFTHREVEAMRLEVNAMQPTQFGPQNEQKPIAWVAHAMGVTERHVRRLLASADELMYYHSLANPNFVGWVRSSDRRARGWVLQVPTEREAVTTLKLVQKVAQVVRKIA